MAASNTDSIKENIKNYTRFKGDFQIDGDRIILEKLKTDSVSIFRDISKKGTSISEITYSEYKEEVFKRNKL